MNNKINVCCKNNEVYSPLEVRNLIEKAEKENPGGLEDVLNNKNKYKDLWEMYHGLFLALALYKKFGAKFKFHICHSLNDPPDLYFIDGKSRRAFAVEIMELYRHKVGFASYEEIVKHIWDKKGEKYKEQYYLLLTSRLNKDFNVTRFVEEIKRYKWDFHRIFISFYTASKQQWTFFEVFPFTQYNDKANMYFNLIEDKKFWY